MSDAPATLDAVLDLVWQTLDAAASGERKEVREVAFATVSDDGAPTLRTVILRSVDRVLARVEFHADDRSSKIAHLTARSSAAMLVWDRAAALQIRLAGTSRVLTGEAAEAAWSSVPEAARRNYGGSHPPGTRLADPRDYAARPAFDRFARVVLDLDRIEALNLSADPHRRALFERADGFTGSWVAP